MLPAIAAAAIPSAVKMISGGIQALRGRSILKKNKRPDYEIMPEFQQNVEMAEDIRSLGGMPKASYQNALQNISRNQTAGLQGLRGRGGAVAGVSAINQSTNDATLGLDAQDAEMRLRNFTMGTQLKMNALTALATQRLKKQEWDKLMPFNQNQAWGQGLIGAGMQNAMGGLGEVANLAVSDIMMNDGDGINSLFPKKMPAAAATRPAMATLPNMGKMSDRISVIAGNGAKPSFAAYPRIPMVQTPSMQIFGSMNQPSNARVPYRPK